MPIVTAYLYWYYCVRTKDILNIIKNYIRFWVFFFSIKQTLKSLFLPWKMMDLPQKGSYITAILETLFNNLFARVMGLIMRTILLSIFLVFEIITIAIGILVFFIWIFMPIVLVWIIYSCIKTNV